jgi:translation elongation factor EF-4
MRDMRYSDSKIQELVKVIGETVSENFSPTLRAKLVSINEFAGVCTMEVVESPYTSMKTMGSLNEDKIGMRYEAPIYRIHNAFFF